MSQESQKELLQTWSAFVSPERWALIQKVASERTRYLTVVLEEVYQGHNAAAVVRSCDGFGIQDLYVIEGRNRFDLSQSTVSKGSHKWIDVHSYKKDADNTTACLRALKAQGYRIVATALDEHSVGIDAVPLDQKIALVMGTELEGLTPEAFAEADLLVKLPMYGFCQSYNLSVSTALCLYDITQRLRQSSVDWRLREEERRELLYSWLKKMVQG